MIELHKVSKIYSSKKGDITAIEDINLHVAPGEIYGVIGRSGAGKSTLIRCVNLLERPTRGRVVVDNQDLIQLSERELRYVRHNIGMIFQNFNLLTTRTVYQNIAFPLQLMSKLKKEYKNKIDELLALTGLSRRAQAYPSQLSGGQKQRVAIARALATEPKVLLCDEITSALDPETTQSILDLIVDINNQLGITVLLITHEMDVIKKIADQVMVLENGQVIEQGSVLDIFKQPKQPITKRLTQTALQIKLPLILQQKLQKSPIEDGYALIRISFVGKATKEPIIQNLAVNYQLQVNILQGNLEHLHSEIFGIMVVACKGKSKDLDAAMRYLIKNQLSIEVIGYVTADDWYAA